MFLQCRQRPFWSLAILLDFGVLYELFRVLIDAEVCEMDKPFADIFRLGIVLIRGEPSQSFPEHVNPKRIVTSN